MGMLSKSGDMRRKREKWGKYFLTRRIGEGRDRKWRKYLVSEAKGRLAQERGCRLKNRVCKWRNWLVKGGPEEGVDSGVIG